MNTTIEVYGYEAYAAQWGCDPQYDRHPRLPGDGYKFYNFGSDDSLEFLESFVPAIDRTILEVEARKTSRHYRKAEKNADLSDLMDLRVEVLRRIKEYGT